MQAIANHRKRNSSNTPYLGAPPLRVLVIMILAAVINGGCSSLPADVERTPSYAIAATPDTRIGAAVAPMLESHPGLSGFHALSDGIHAFRVRQFLIDYAQATIDVQYYIWHRDDTGTSLYRKLLLAAERGVRVRILLDDLDTAGKDSMLHIIDSHPNIEIRLFNPFANRKRRAEDFITDTRRVNHRMHNKTLTVDNQASIFGGRNIGDEYFDAATDVAFTDLDALAIGPVVQEISGMFDLYWNSQWVYPLAAFKTDEPIDKQQIALLQQQFEELLLQAEHSDYAAQLQRLNMEGANRFTQLDFQWGRWVLGYDQPGKVEATSISGEYYLAPRLKQAIESTQQDLVIVSPYFVPGKTFTRLLVDMVQRGVRIRILTNSLASNDVALVHAGYMRYRKDLLAGGVELYEFKADKSQYTQKEKKQGQWTGSSRASLHGKFLAFDRRYVFIGSFNLDGRSTAINTELGVYFESPVYAREIITNFNQQSMRKAYRVVLDEDGDLLWLTLDDGKEVRFDKEPDTGFWTRFSVGFLSLFVPEGQL